MGCHPRLALEYLELPARIALVQLPRDREAQDSGAHHRDIAAGGRQVAQRRLIDSSSGSLARSATAGRLW